ncbi:YraN family protein [Clostridium sp. MB05]|jgi:putative endonuclease|uniref:YraN family protein n=1 Tax=Clostridium sp. MB05 TaxID=3376682 RepID=UPI003982D1F3
MNSYNKCIGTYGEDLASSYLKSKGYYILNRNFRNKHGEIDLICKYSDLIIFVEVKSRYNYSYGIPSESVTYSKQKQIINLCKFYILSRKLFNYNCRFDVIEIYFNKNNESYFLNHIEDAFRGY